MLCAGFYYRGHKNPIFYFLGAEKGYFGEASTREQTTVEPNERICNAFHTPTSRATPPGILGISHHFPSIPLESILIF
jgi:hypothetical protein